MVLISAYGEGRSAAPEPPLRQAPSISSGAFDFRVGRGLLGCEHISAVIALEQANPGSPGPSWGMPRTTTIEPPQRPQSREGVAGPSRAAASAATLNLSLAILSFTSNLRRFNSAISRWSIEAWARALASSSSSILCRSSKSAIWVLIGMKSLPAPALLLLCQARGYQQLCSVTGVPTTLKNSRVLHFRDVGLRHV